MPALCASSPESRIRLPRNGDDALHYYRKVGTRKAQAISKICFAAYARRERGGVLGEVRIGLGSVALSGFAARARA